MHIKKQRLLTPGPTPLLPQALHAMMESDIHHRTETFRKIYATVLADLKEVFNSKGEVLSLVASGTGAMEAAASNFFSKGDKVIVCSAGKFGERWAEIAKAYGLDATVLKKEYGDVVSAAEVADTLKQGDYKGVFVQASETSTGAQHDVKGMAEAIRKTGALFVVDAITGLGTQPLDIDGWGLDVVIGGSQKSFMIPPGLAFMSVSEKAWERAESSDLPKYYFNLKKERKSAQKGDPTWTPNTSHIIALGEALKYIKALGMEKLIENAQLLARATREAAVELGLELFSPGAPSSSVTALRAPKGMDSGVIVKEFKTRFGSVIANGQGTMQGQIFRIAHLGYFDFSDLFAIIAQLEIILAANGQPVQYGKGVAAVQRVYAEVAGLKESKVPAAV